MSLGEVGRVDEGWGAEKVRRGGFEVGGGFCF